MDITLPIRAKGRVEGASAWRTDWFADDFMWIQVMGRLHPQLDPTAAESELGAIAAANIPEAARRILAPEFRG